ncbi:MAG: ribonuclease J [Clostridium sp.]|nr:ribonuclease J [Clostridium sp.]MCM1444613.1 ribonuclease J [Candidatus Amulumruptor caecigallinarius]
MSKIKIFGLGGLNEMGKNMYVVEVDNDIFVFDAGLKYADDRMLGVDYIIPNYDYLKENKNRIKGFFITHGHDGQMGALSDILLDIPNIKIYGTPFTLEVIKSQLLEDNIKCQNLIEIKPYKKISFKENSIFPVSLTHSAPDTVGYALYTRDGIIFYTGNFLFDASMLGAFKTDIGKLAYIGKQGVLCLLSESSYADKKGYTSPNHRIDSVIRETLYNNPGRILINISPAQIYRIDQILTEVASTNRNVVIMGKRIENIILKSIEMGYIKFDRNRIKSIFNAEEARSVVIISDEREKPFSNIKRIIKGYDKFVKITDKDTIIFASPVYDGMEKSATKVLDDISKIGSNIVTLPEKKYLANHASSEDLMLMIDLMSPKYYFPVNGEYRHQVANKDTALKVGIKEENIILKQNGEVATFVDGVLQENNETVKVDDILIDGKTAGDIGELVLKDRESLGENGIVIITVTLDKVTKNLLAGPEILTRGFIYVKENIDIIKEATSISKNIIENNIRPNYVDFNKIKMDIRDKVGKYFYEQTECKPMILIVVQEV